MKVKIKLTIEQFKALIFYFNIASVNSKNEFRPIDLVNLESFLNNGCKKLIDFKSKNLSPLKLKTFSFDINHLYLITDYLRTNFNDLDSYMLTIYNCLIIYERSMLN